MERIEGRSEGLFGGKLKSFIGSIIPGAQTPADQMPMTPTRDPVLDFSFQTQPPTFFERNKGLIIGVGAVVLIGGIYFITKKKK
jgi:hypothetical protein